MGGPRMWRLTVWMADSIGARWSCASVLGPAILCASVLGTAWLAAGCSGATAGATPESTLAAFARALREGDAEHAYGLMSQAYRRRISLEEFRRTLRDNDQEAQSTARALSQLASGPQEHASVEYGEGDSLRLIREDDGWRVVTDIVDYYDQSTPRAALRSFVRALEHRRYDVVLGLVPGADREGMSAEQLEQTWEGDEREEIERLHANLRAALDNPIEEVGDRATMPYAERFRVAFVREGGDWCIEDPD